MSKKVSVEELDRIVQVVRSYPDGVGIEGISGHAGIDLPHRTLQRRLAQLVDAKRLVPVGQGRGMRYKAAAASPQAVEVSIPALAIQPQLFPPAIGVYVPVSPAGAEIKAYAQQPVQTRSPVGYNQNFLEAYQPNQTYYLPESLRLQLRRLGETPEAERPAGTFARDILTRLLIDLSWASSRLEGNTYSRLDTERLIEFGQVAVGKEAVETQMILNHKAAIEFLVSEAGETGFVEHTILNLHALLSDGLLADPRACGRIRERVVGIGGSVYLPIALPQRLKELFHVVLDMAQEIIDPFEQAFFAMVHLPYLQPFEDVNKRVSRLAANIPLIRHNLCPLSFIDVPERSYLDAMLGVYELNRIELLRDFFVWAYERSCQQYLAVQRQLMPPDAFRLRYRKELSVAIKAMVTSRRPVNAEAVWSVIPQTIPEEEKERFASLVITELPLLYEGNAIRFGLRPLEIAAWRQDMGWGKENEHK